jgi:hypothetical protein
MLDRFQSIDRRFLYLLLFFTTAASLIWQRPLRVVPSNQAKAAHAAIEKAPVDKIALIGAEWSASTRGENGAQTKAIFHHLMSRKIKLAIVGFDPQGPKNVGDIADELAAQYGYVYGRDYINFGFRPAGSIKATLKAMVRNFAGTLTQDTKSTALTDTTKLPIMQQLRTIDDVGIIVEITASATYEDWVAFVQGVKGTPMVLAPTAVMAPEAYQFLDSGQISGMLSGLKGALEYEFLVDKPDRASKQALALSVSHILIIVLIVLGNVGYIAQRRRAQAERGA